MINEKNVKKFCIDGQIHLIENYTEAINDKNRMWDCHHRKETDENKTKQQLIDAGMYYGRPAQELIFLTREEHTSIHHKGKTRSDETKKKLSEAHKGNQNFKGKHHNEETKKKMSEAKQGKPRKKCKWLTHTGEIVEMSIAHAKQWHPGWIIINE